jgi:cell division transport system permease protein
MKLRQTPYFLVQALKNLRNNFWVHLVGAGTMTISLVIFGAFLLVFVNVNSWVQSLGGIRSMSIFLIDGVSEEQLQKVRDAIDSIAGAKVDKFISKDDALRDMRRLLGSHKGLIENLDSNPLPASFEVLFEEKAGPFNMGSVSSMLETLEGVESVQVTEEWVSRLEGFLAMVQIIGIVIGGLLGVGVLMIVTNTIRLTIYARKDEIEILKLVGATDAFVKTPFLLEGVIHGLVAGAAALGILFFGYMIFSVKKDHMLGFAVLSFDFIPAGHAIALCATGVVLGLCGSFIALGRFFRV